MFCPKCGANQPDGTQFCSSCGANIGPAQPQQAQPVYQQPYPNRPVNPVSKGKYLSTMATSKTKVTAKIALIMTLVCIVVMVAGYFAAMNTSIENVPIMSLALDASGGAEDFDDMKDEAQDQVEQIQDEMDAWEDEVEAQLTSKQQRALEDMVESMEDFAETMSMRNIQKMMDAAEALVKTDVDEYMDVSSFVSDIDEMNQIIGVISGVLLAGAIFSLLFTIIGGLCRVTPLVVVGMIFSTIFCLIFYGFLFVLLNLAAHIALIVMLSSVNKEYKAYRNGALPV